MQPGAADAGGGEVRDWWEGERERERVGVGGGETQPLLQSTECSTSWLHGEGLPESDREHVAPVPNESVRHMSRNEVFTF